MKTHLKPNNGPLMFEAHPDDRMYYFQFNIEDYLSGVAGMKPAEVGIYTIIFALMYQKMGMLRDDDRYIAGHCNCDLRTYREHRRKLLEAGKIYEADGYLYNNRVLEEIAKFCTTMRKKREAAKAREANKASETAAAAARAAAREAELQAQDRKKAEGNCPVSPLSPATSPVSNDQTSGKNCDFRDEKFNKNNDRNARAVPEHRLNQGTALAEQAGEKDKDKESPPPKGGSPVAPVAGGGGQGSLNLGISLPPIGRATTPQPSPDLRPGEEEIAPNVYRGPNGIRHRFGYFVVDFAALTMQLVLANLGMSRTECEKLARQLAEAKAVDWGARIAAGQLSTDVLPKDPIGAIRGWAVKMRADQRNGMSGARGRSPEFEEMVRQDREASARAADQERERLLREAGRA